MEENLYEELKTYVREVESCIQKTKEEIRRSKKNINRIRDDLRSTKYPYPILRDKVNTIEREQRYCRSFTREDLNIKERNDVVQRLKFIELFEEYPQYKNTIQILYKIFCIKPDYFHQYNFITSTCLHPKNCQRTLANAFLNHKFLENLEEILPTLPLCFLDIALTNDYLLIKEAFLHYPSNILPMILDLFFNIDHARKPYYVHNYEQPAFEPEVTLSNYLFSILEDCHYKENAMYPNFRLSYYLSSKKKINNTMNPLSISEFVTSKKLLDNTCFKHVDPNKIPPVVLFRMFICSLTNNSYENVFYVNNLYPYKTEYKYWQNLYSLACKEGSGLILFDNISLMSIMLVKDVIEFISLAKKHVLDVEKIPYDEFLQELEGVNT